MNVSMQDTFNLGCKLAHVLTGRANASLLCSYSTERWDEADGRRRRYGCHRSTCHRETVNFIKFPAPAK
jgi:2-polyprenyl-6-methoxyphenol hydroxylase-like FAD-dependent oxidoreductase